MNEILDIDALNKATNDLTDLDTELGGPGFKLINIHLLACYNAIVNRTLAQLAIVAFNFIMRDKFYGENANERKDGIDEENRIYSDIKIVLDDILGELGAGKYADKRAVANDQSNTNKRLKELDDNNIFYVWRYKKWYMFVLERDLRMWKNFNSKAFVLPKTLKKILALGSDMITCMCRHVKSEVDKTGIEKSFGLFINGIIDKMNPIVSLGLTRWNGKDDVVDKFLVELSTQLNRIPDEEASAIDGDIFNRLPASVADRLFRNQKKEMEMKKKKVENDVQTNLEKDIVPANANLVGARRTRTKKKAAPPSTGVTVYSYDGDVNPFEDAPSFMNYYTAFMQYSNNKVRLEAFEIDVRDALEVLDLLAVRGHTKGDSNDKTFLNAWLKYFYDHKLKGEKILKAKYTSVKAFKESFSEFLKCGSYNYSSLV